MDIRLIPAGGGPKFTFPALPGRIQGKYGAKYQSMDIISQGAVKIPRGTDVAEFSWDGVFFGRSKRGEPVVRHSHWKNPNECVRIIRKFVEGGTALTLIVTGTWINVDVTVSSFQPMPAGAYGNVEYSITLIQRKPLRVYTTDELKVAAYAQQTKPREDPGEAAGGSVYTVVSGDTLWKIASSKLGTGSRWTEIYDANAAVIEEEAKKHGKENSDHGHWICAGTALSIPG